MLLARAVSTSKVNCIKLIFSDALQALSKRHSTTEEALRVAADMGAYRTVLTHFSQRYPKIPVGVPTSGKRSVGPRCDEHELTHSAAECVPSAV